MLDLSSNLQGKLVRTTHDAGEEDGCFDLYPSGVVVGTVQDGPFTEVLVIFSKDPNADPILPFAPYWFTEVELVEILLLPAPVEA